MAIGPHMNNPFDKSPKKKKTENRINNLAYSIFTVAMVCVVLFCGFTFVDKHFNDYVIEKEYEEIRGETVTPDPSRAPGGFGDIESLPFPDVTFNPGQAIVPQRPTVDYVPTEIEEDDGYINKEKTVWDLYEKTNPDVVAWLYIPELVDYPVAMDDSEYYLNHSIYHTESASGALFMSSLNNLNPLGYNTIIHGHNMTKETMFGKLKYYTTLGTQAFFDTHRRIYLDTLYGTFRFEVFSVYITNKDDPDYRRHYFATDEEYIEYLNRLQDRTMFKGEHIDFDVYDRVLTLSTCNSDEGSTKRTIVHARLVWPNPEGIKPVETPTPTPEITPGTTPEVGTTPDPDTTPDIQVTPGPTVETVKRVVKLGNEDGSLKLRKKKSTSSDILDRLKHGTVLEVLEDDGDWLKVSVNGKIGYVSKKYTVPYDEFDGAPTKEPTKQPDVEPTPELPEDTESPEVTPESTPELPEETEAPEGTESPEVTPEITPEPTPEVTPSTENTEPPQAEG